MNDKVVQKNNSNESNSREHGDIFNNKMKDESNTSLIVYYLLGKFFEYGLNFVFFYLSRIWIPIEIIGKISLILSITLIYSFIIDLGLSVAHITIYNSNDGEEHKRKCNTTLFIYKMIQFLIYIAISFILLFTLTDLKSTFNVSLIIIIYNVFLLFSGVFFTPILLSRNNSLINAITLIIGSLFKILILFYIYYTNIISLYSFSIVYLIGAIGLFVISLFLCRNLKFSRIDSFYLKKYGKFALPFILSSLSWMIYQNITAIFINDWFSEIEVAIFVTAQQLFFFFSNIPNMISDVLLPNLSRLSINEEKRSKDLIIYKNQRYSLIFFIIILIYSFTYSEYLVDLVFGVDYKGTGIIFNLLMVSNIIGLNSFGIRADLQARNKVFFTESISILFLTFYIISCYVFISPYFLNLGLIGSGYAVILSQLLYWLIFNIIAWKKYQYKYDWKIFRILFILIFQVLLNNWIMSVANNSFIWMIFIGVITLILYGFFIYILKMFSSEDLQFMKSFFLPKNMMNTIKNQFK